MRWWCAWLWDGVLCAAMLLLPLGGETDPDPSYESARLPGLFCSSTSKHVSLTRLHPHSQPSFYSSSSSMASITTITSITINLSTNPQHTRTERTASPQPTIQDPPLSSLPRPPHTTTRTCAASALSSCPIGGTPAWTVIERRRAAMGVMDIGIVIGIIGVIGVIGVPALQNNTNNNHTSVPVLSERTPESQPTQRTCCSSCACAFLVLRVQVTLRGTCRRNRLRQRSGPRAQRRGRRRAEGRGRTHSERRGAHGNRTARTPRCVSTLSPHALVLRSAYSARRQLAAAT